MTTALSILTTHHLCLQGGAPAICVDVRGRPTDCTWKASRRKGAGGAGQQHREHLAALIDAAYAEQIGLRDALRSVCDVLEDWQMPFALDGADVKLRALHNEIAGCLEEVAL